MRRDVRPAACSTRSYSLKNMMKELKKEMSQGLGKSDGKPRSNKSAANKRKAFARK
jgi:hypothetical protein